ncbi:MAG: cytochrome c peroxidase [Azonexus sp.]|jgi:cytochrome c peroxidase|nr:cytochrome c peroxidase [Azonexus sp.]
MKSFGLKTFAAIATLSLAAGSVTANELRTTAKSLFGSVTAASKKEINDPKALLGQALFWDMRLSSNGKVACASCHYQENWGSDERPRSINARGGKTLQSQTVFHSQDTPGLRWLADRASGAAQAMGSITGSMGFAKREDILPVMEKFGYVELFQKAFPGEATAMSVENYGKALEAYQRTLRTPAPFDKWLNGDDKALTAVQKKGLENFINVGCVGCHRGSLIGGDMLQRFGIVDNYWSHTGSADIDSGLMKNTGKEEDRFFFRVPLLRNIAKTQPYFHDGSVADLKKATDIMAKVQLGQTLDDNTLNELVAFMESLTGNIPVNFVAPAGIPFELPEGVKKK